MTKSDILDQLKLECRQRINYGFTGLAAYDNNKETFDRPAALETDATDELRARVAKGQTERNRLLGIYAQLKDQINSAATDAAAAGIDIYSDSIWEN